jgi:AcrR family transcriptional regulator
VTNKQRAEPLPREDRRQAILEAVIPLLLEHGSNITTAEMARAAGIAEGTIFRVFADKVALLDAAVRTSLDPAEAMERMAAVDRSLDLGDQLREVASVLVERSERIHALVAVLRSFPPPVPGHHADAHRAAIEANSLIYRSLTRMFSQNRESLIVEPARAAAAFRGLLYAINFPLTDPAERLTVDEAVEILLWGVMPGDRGHR